VRAFVRVAPRAAKRVPSAAPPMPRARCRHALRLRRAPPATRCGRPVAYCWCPHLVSLPTRTRVVLLQHPRERGLAIGTAHMASLCLPNAELHVGTHLGRRARPRARLVRPRPPRRAALPRARGPSTCSRTRPTGPSPSWWSMAPGAPRSKVVARNPVLSSLPRYAFSPPAPGEYRIRREPTATCVSTLEALVYALGALERDPERFRAMLAPFRAMIDAQLAAEATLHNHRGARPHVRRVRRVRVRRRPLRGRLADVVCVAGRGQRLAPPRRPEAPPRGPTRWFSGVAPSPRHGRDLRGPRGARPTRIAPATASHTGLDAAAPPAGASPARSALATLARLRARHRPRLRLGPPTAPDLWQAAGAHLPPARLDLRVAARHRPPRQGRHPGRLPRAPRGRRRGRLASALRAHGRAGDASSPNSPPSPAASPKRPEASKHHAARAMNAPRASSRTPPAERLPSTRHAHPPPSSPPPRSSPPPAPPASPPPAPAATRRHRRAPRPRPRPRPPSPPREPLLLVSGRSLGPVQLGMTVTALRALGGPLQEASRRGDDVTYTLAPLSVGVRRNNTVVRVALTVGDHPGGLRIGATRIARRHAHGDRHRGPAGLRPHRAQPRRRGGCLRQRPHPA
jgi:DTW domain-containing protein YfiP